MYYGNPLATDGSNGTATFEFYDGFDTVSTGIWGANAANWRTTNGVAYSTVAGASSQITATG